MTIRHRMTVRATVSVLMVAVWVFPGAVRAQEVGPPRGALVIVGGAMRDPAIVERFIRLAGGPQAPIVVIPTAGGAETYDQYYPGLRAFTEVGATDLTVLHTTDRKEANSEAFVEPLRRARGVWFPGGRQWRLADAYLDTRVHEELRGVLNRGGVVGGSSAGATILGSYLARGDSATNTIMMGDHEVGLGFLRNVAIDQHLLRRNRQFDLLEVIEARPDLLGIGLDEDTAIVVQGDEFEVMGRSYVVIYDHGRVLDSGGRFYFLGAGDRYDLKTREPFRMQRARRPLDRVVARPW
ncbi:MAG: cyanophycinase [Vicinamibacterales bacterium]|nr:cyanophycinase [Vicinamibacterales bacterium]